MASRSRSFSKLASDTAAAPAAVSLHLLPLRRRRRAAEYAIGLLNKRALCHAALMAFLGGAAGRARRRADTARKVDQSKPATLAASGRSGGGTAR